MIKFSILLPVRNGARYVSEAINTVLSQTRRDFELIVLDNLSDDGTWEIVSECAKADARVRCIRSQKALSIDESWDRIRDLCQAGKVNGEFLSLLGHDDRLMPDFLAVVASLIESNPEAGLFQTHFRLIDSDGRTIRPCRAMAPHETLGEFFVTRCKGLIDSFGTGYVFRQADYIACGGIPLYPLLLFSDDMLWLRLLKNGPKITSEKACFEYRSHRASTSGEHYSTEKYVSFLQAFKLFVRDFEKDFAFLLEQDDCRRGFRDLIGTALRYVEKGSYRLGLNRDLFREDWQPLAARFDQLGYDLGERADVPTRLRYRPLKRGLHVMRRLIRPAK